MIKYTLVCEASHSFEGWFRNSGDFEAQCERKFVVCPMCGATDVRKALMAPAVSTSRKREALSPVASIDNAAAPAAPASKKETPQPVSTPPMQPSALLPENLRQKEIVEALRLVRTRIMENSENVGSEFASEARKIHYGETEERSIYGETSLQDAEELLEEGISVLPLPELPDDKN
ncbi:MAG: DUF1178 family protein [Roseibium sp.]|uniref:DUF1178 family protein n=1 Tax=Roseibium sp. TaxID=1936156 RepID=UPI002616A0B9|nr:DUF1178 family protein [Roseibium sp.]MCV0424530.1 DUF1178 family protein [Roseibium sp.]